MLEQCFISIERLGLSVSFAIRTGNALHRHAKRDARGLNSVASGLPEQPRQRNDAGAALVVADEKHWCGMSTYGAVSVHPVWGPRPL